MIKFLTMVILCLSPSALAADNRVRIRLGPEAPALHMPIGDQNVEIEPAFEDYSFIMFDICDAMDLTATNECLVYPMNGSLGGNAIATVHDGNKIIIYDRELSPKIGYEGAEMVIAHELGHHFCDHIGKTAHINQELEADRFAGAAMKLMGRSLGGALSAVHLFETRPSKSHPARNDRINAITEGWNNPSLGKICSEN